MKIRIMEDDNRDNRSELDIYHKQLADYNKEMEIYNDTYTKWYNNTPKVIINDIGESLNDITRQHLDNLSIKSVRNYYGSSVKPIRKGTDKSTYQFYIYDRVVYGRNLTNTYYIDKESLINIIETQIIPDWISYCDNCGGYDIDTSINDTENNDDLKIEIRFTYDILNKYAKPTKPKLTKPKRPIKPKRPAKIGAVDGVYTLNKNYGYADVDEFYDLFDKFGYNLENETEAAELFAELKQAGWIKGNRIYIPKETQFVEDEYINGYNFITLTNGPFKGAKLGFLSDEPQLSLDYLIRRYTY